jgi:hypothetical protein
VRPPASAVGVASGTNHAAGVGAGISQADVLEILNRQTDAGNALVLAGLVEDWLEKVLLAKGRSLENSDAKKIFGIGGPLSTFAAKIDISFMFEIIDEKTRADLVVLKSIRNAFAHTTRYVFFDSEHIAAKCRKLSNWTEGIDNQTCYREKARECVNVIKQQMERFIYANALMEPPSIVESDD